MVCPFFIYCAVRLRERQILIVNRVILWLKVDKSDLRSNLLNDVVEMSDINATRDT
jgi:hypothetical protein